MPSFVKPRYIDSAGEPGRGTISFGPPILFRDVTARVFPLKANMGVLTQFCDQYLNMDIPDDIVRFTPALPFVYFTILNYGGMSATSLEAQRVGWVAQREVTFTIPLLRWKRNNEGDLDFQDWASVSPFIFVDDPMSQTTGREVYGWPKVLAHIDADMSKWADDPRLPDRLFSISANMFADVYAGEEETQRVLVQVDRDSIASYARFPPDAKFSSLLTSIIPNMVRSSVSLAGDAVDIASGLRLRGYPPGRTVNALTAMTAKASSMAVNMLSGLILPDTGDHKHTAGNITALRARAAKELLPKLFNQTVNLKQFRDPESPNLACYSAIVQSPMGVDRVNGFGLLGDWDLLTGDRSGGYRVRIHRYASQPIIESLGLEVATIEEGSHSTPVAVLKPTIPFWVDVNLFYGAGEVLCSRTSGVAGPGHKDVWVDEVALKRIATASVAMEAATVRFAGNPASIGEGVAKFAEAAGEFGRAAAAVTSAEAPNVFNNAIGAANQAVVGPFHFPDTTLQVYPLLADETKLQAYVDRCWNEPFTLAEGECGPRLTFRTFGSYVYMIVTVNGDRRGTMWSNNNNVGWWAEREVSFCLPVKWYKDGRLVGVALIEPFVYANSGRAVITDREVNGRNSVVASIDSPRDPWIAPDGPAAERQLLHAATEIFPALDLGQRARQRVLFEIDKRDVLPHHDKEGWQDIADIWGQNLVGDLKRKVHLAADQQSSIADVKALALEILAHEAPVNRLTLKQYRDASDMDSACYQAAVLTERSVTRIYDIREIEKMVHVRINRVPGHPIVETLGLKVKSVDSHGGNVIDNLQPIRPFWMHAAVKEELGTILGTVVNSIERARPEDVAARRWVFKHPWVAPPAADAGAKAAARSDQLSRPVPVSALRASYFSASGRTRVGSSLATQMEGENRQNLHDSANTWLRRSVANELALAKESIIRLSPEARHTFDRRISEMGPELPGLVQELADTDVGGSRTFRRFYDGLSIPQADELARAIEQAFAKDLDTIPLKTLPGDSEGLFTAEDFSPTALGPFKASELFDKASKIPRLNQVPDLKATDTGLMADLIRIILWTMKTPESENAGWFKVVPVLAKFYIWGLQVARLWIEKMQEAEPARARMLTMALPSNVWGAIETLLPWAHGPIGFYEMQQKHDEDKALSDLTVGPVGTDPTLVLQALASALISAVFDWQDPSRWRRLTRDEARCSIETLADVQLVIEEILGDEWESRNSYLRTRRPAGALPDAPSKPRHSVPVASVGPVGLTASPWGIRLGLKRWPEKEPDAVGTWEFVAVEPPSKV